MKLKLNKHWTTGQVALQRFNIALLRGTGKLNEFRVVLNKKFQDLQNSPKEEGTIMENIWKRVKEALTSTCQVVLGRNEHHHKE
ncbi:unnamed protein product [Schistosoma margrebowiei]|uniref:Uncharacterized protein n=1 Tax=Schistosoma margrebowiei TaxID=48269 RepID=A0A183N221_9TREM|nr:unnamed protein product [Schistosoma margrebowiei]